MEKNTAFYIIDSKPAKGMEIDMNLIVHQDDILLALAEAGIIKCKEGGIFDYNGKLSVICANGLLLLTLIQKGAIALWLC